MIDLLLSPATGVVSAQTVINLVIAGVIYWKVRPLIQRLRAPSALGKVLMDRLDKLEAAVKENKTP